MNNNNRCNMVDRRDKHEIYRVNRGVCDLVSSLVNYPYSQLTNWTQKFTIHNV